MNPFGTRIVETVTATKIVQDWSRVRSPARAARRLKRGYRQNIVERHEPSAYGIGGVIYAHPEFVRALRQAVPMAQS
jgi:hypothetical protein